MSIDSCAPPRLNVGLILMSGSLKKALEAPS